MSFNVFVVTLVAIMSVLVIVMGLVLSNSGKSAKKVACSKKQWNYIDMGKQVKYIKKITKEYISFMRKTESLVEEAKRATVLTLKKVLELKDGDEITIKDDGSLDIKTI